MFTQLICSVVAALAILSGPRAAAEPAQTETAKARLTLTTLHDAMRDSEVPRLKRRQKIEEAVAALSELDEFKTWIRLPLRTRLAAIRDEHDDIIAVAEEIQRDWDGTDARRTQRSDWQSRADVFSTFLTLRIYVGLHRSDAAAYVETTAQLNDLRRSLTVKRVSLLNL